MRLAGRSVIHWALLAGACAIALCAPAMAQPVPGQSLPNLDGFQNIPIAPTGPDNIFARPPTPPPVRSLQIAPRTGRRFEMETVADRTFLVTGGIIPHINNLEHPRIIPIQADNLVIWTKGDTQEFLRNLQSTQGAPSREDEFYLSGNVVLRAGQGPQERVLRADELYYDVSRNIAVAVSADLELRDKRLPEPM